MDFKNYDFGNCDKTPVENQRLPYYRCYRPILNRIDDDYYLIDDEYADHPYYYVRAFLQIQDEMKKLFLYVEPSDTNRVTYSYHIQQLLIRTCIEIETNLKAILKANKYSRKESKWNMEDYRCIDVSHKLSDYKVTLPIWDGEYKLYQPFASWKTTHTLDWYKAYTNTKHNSKINDANLENLMNAFCGLFVVLTAQFNDLSYEPGLDHIVMSCHSRYYGGRYGIGEYLEYVGPHWNDDEKYNVNWSLQCKESVRFSKFDYDMVKLEYNSQKGIR